MEKSMYSLILIDEVVRKIDELAHVEGTSRSSLVNEILARHVSYLTPLKRVEEIFESITRAVRESGGGLQARKTSPGMMNIKSVLNFRYNPTIRYGVEIALEEGRYICRLKVSARTQSEDLRTRLSVFYEIWSQIESENLRGKLKEPLRFSMSGEHFKRVLQIEQGGAMPDSQTLGTAIGAYIRAFDKALKLSFTGDYGIDIQIFKQITELYQTHIAQSAIIL